MKGHQNYYETFYKEWRQSWVLFNLLHSRLMRPYHPSIILWLLCRERVKILKLSCMYTYLLPPSLARPCGHTVEFLTVEEWNSQVRTGKASCRDYLTGVLFWPWLKGKKKKNARESGVLLHAIQAAQLTPCTALFVLADLCAWIWLWAWFCQRWSVFNLHPCLGL